MPVTTRPLGDDQAWKREVQASISTLEIAMKTIQQQIIEIRTQLGQR